LEIANVSYKKGQKFFLQKSLIIRDGGSNQDVEDHFVISKLIMNCIWSWLLRVKAPFVILSIP